jgi:hypothetical protein
MRFEKSSLVNELEVHSGKLDQSVPDTSGVGFRNSVSVRRFSSSTRSAADSASPDYQAVIAREPWPGNESSAFDVDRADLVFARARETLIRANLRGRFEESRAAKRCRRGVRRLIAGQAACS